jgi:hypothetical protein
MLFEMIIDTLIILLVQRYITLGMSGKHIGL